MSRKLHPHLLIVLTLTLASPLGCKSSPSTMPNPLVRVDLSSRLPRKILKILPAAIDLDCHRKVELAAAGKRQAFVVNWRVADLKGRRHFTAVDVAPVSGPTIGSAQAAVNAGKGDTEKVQVTLHWSFQQGCTSGSADKLLEISAADSSCKSPQPKNLLRPVK